jgi:hypothetical protein
MATQTRGKKLPVKAGSSSSDYYIPPVPLAMATPAKSVGEDIMGWIAACVLVALLLPMGAMLYLDILEAKHEVKAQAEKIERLRRQIERERREKKPSDTISDNPVFDRVRRPFSLPLPRSDKLE